MKPEQLIANYLSEAGYSKIAIKVYVTLLKYGDQTLSQLARNAKIERTKLYRIQDELQSGNLVIVRVSNKRTLLQAAPVEHVQHMLQLKESNIQRLQKTFDVFSAAAGRLGKTQEQTQVKYYRGREGIRQMLWNELNATTTVYCYANKLYELAVGYDFLYKWGAEFHKRGLKGKNLISDSFVESWQAYNGTKKQPERIGTDEFRYLPPHVLDAKNSWDMYNDTIAILNWEGDEMFGIEITNKQIAATQRQIFEYLWSVATPETRL